MDKIVIDAETGEERTVPLTPEELAQRAQDAADDAAQPRPKAPAAYRDEWQALNADIADLADAWEAATAAQRQALLRSGIVAVNRKIGILAQFVARGMWEPAEHDEAAP